MLEMDDIFLLSFHNYTGKLSWILHYVTMKNTGDISCTRDNRIGDVLEI